MGRLRQGLKRLRESVNSEWRLEQNEKDSVKQRLEAVVGKRRGDERTDLYDRYAALSGGRRADPGRHRGKS